MQQEQEMQQVQQVHQLPHLPPGVVGHAELQGAGGGLGEVLAARLEATQASCCSSRLPAGAGGAAGAGDAAGTAGAPAPSPASWCCWPH